MNENKHQNICRAVWMHYFHANNSFTMEDLLECCTSHSIPDSKSFMYMKHYVDAFAKLGMLAQSGGKYRYKVINSIEPKI